MTVHIRTAADSIPVASGNTESPDNGEIRRISAGRRRTAAQESQCRK